MNEKEFEELPMMMKISDVQKILGIGRNSVFELIYQKNFPIFRPSERIIRIPKTEFLQWLKENIKVYQFK